MLAHLSIPITPSVGPSLGLLCALLEEGAETPLPPPKYKGVQLEAVMGQLPFPRRQMGLAARRGAGEQQLCLLMCLQILTS